MGTAPELVGRSALLAASFHGVPPASRPQPSGEVHCDSRAGAAFVNPLESGVAGQAEAASPMAGRILAWVTSANGLHRNQRGSDRTRRGGPSTRMAPLATAAAQVSNPWNTSASAGVVVVTTTSGSKPGCWTHTDASPRSTTIQTALRSGAV